MKRIQASGSRAWPARGGRRRAPWAAIALLGVVGAALPAAAQEPRPAIVEFSNGETLEGRVSLTPGAALTLVESGQQWVLTWDRLRAIRWAPEEERLEQNWRFVAPGQTRKEKWGAPYPVRHLRATVELADGATLAGHLFTTVLYVEGADKNHKVILAAKQRGRAGEALEQLVYPVSLRFTDTAAPVEGELKLSLDVAGAVTALTRGPLVRLEARGGRLPSPLGAEVFVAVHNPAGITVGWPAETDTALEAAVRAALPAVRDFFDTLHLHGVWRDPVSGDVFTLLMLERRRPTTLAGEAARTQPWRCEVWRWKLQEPEQRLMVAGRGYFFRGIVARGESAPPVKLSPTLWNLKRVGDELRVPEP
jgi:hypothetical protein